MPPNTSRDEITAAQLSDVSQASFASREATQKGGYLQTSSTTLPPQRLTLKSLQAGRALAAILVVFVHLNGAIFGRAKYFPHIFWRGFSFGHAGVEYFFVLSGFIIVYIHSADIGRPHRLYLFVQKRFFRIYPVYWIVLILALPVLLTARHYVPQGGSYLLTILSDATLLPFPYLPDLAVAWTLKHEVFFYAVFAVIIFNRRIGLAVASVALVGSICVALALSGGAHTFLGLDVQPQYFDSVPLQAAPTMLMLLVNPLHLLFLYGAAVVWLVRKYTIPIPWLFACVGVILFLGNGIYESFWSNHSNAILLSQIYGLAAAVGMTGFIELERTGRIRVPSMLCLLGDASYSLYLIHLPVLSILAKLIVAHGSPSVPPFAIFAGMFVIALASGVTFHILIEKPLLARLK